MDAKDSDLESSLFSAGDVGDNFTENYAAVPIDDTDENVPLVSDGQYEDNDTTHSDQIPEFELDRYYYMIKLLAWVIQIVIHVPLVIVIVLSLVITSGYIAQAFVIDVIVLIISLPFLIIFSLFVLMVFRRTRSERDPDKAKIDIRSISIAIGVILAIVTIVIIMLIGLSLLTTDCVYEQYWSYYYSYSDSSSRDYYSRSYQSVSPSNHPKCTKRKHAILVSATIYDITAPLSIAFIGLCIVAPLYMLTRATNTKTMEFYQKLTYRRLNQVYWVYI